MTESDIPKLAEAMIKRGVFVKPRLDEPIKPATEAEWPEERQKALFNRIRTIISGKDR